MTRTSEFNRWRAVVPNHFIIAVVALALPDVAFAVSTTSSGDDPLGFIIAILIISTGVALVYGFPSVIAFWNRHPNRWVILLINIVFGGTVIGWLAALIWALNKVHDPIAAGSHGGESGLNIFANDVKRVQLEPVAPLMQHKDDLKDLERLAKLYTAGHISETEYSSAKTRILRSIHQ
jgi:hypothetical protein